MAEPPPPPPATTGSDVTAAEVDGMQIDEPVQIKPNQSSVVSRLQKTITVEVIFFLYILGTSLVRLTVQALVYRKVCLEQCNVTVCDNLDKKEYEHEQDQVQTDAAHWYLAENLCFEIPSIILSTFYGSLSDNVSRKAALLLPVIGQILSTTNYVINSVYMDLPVGYILFGPFISGIFGGWVSCGMACFSYLSDTTTPKNRTTRIAIADCFISCSYALSAFVGGRMLDSTSFTFVTSLALGVYVLSAVYTVVWIREPPSSARAEKRQSWGAIWRNVFNRKAIKAALGCVFRKRQRNRRAQIMVSLGVLMTGSVGLHAEFSLTYLFVRKHPLSWSQSRYGYFSGYAHTLAAISQLVIMPLFRDRLRMRDTNILTVSFISISFSMVLFAFSTHTWMVFMVPLVGIFGPLHWAMLRSMLSKMVENEELGRMFAVFGALQSVNGLISSLLYNNLYPATLEFWNGLCFIIGAVICLLPLLLSTWLGRDLKKHGWESYGALKEDKTDGRTEGVNGEVTRVEDNENKVLPEGSGKAIGLNYGTEEHAC